MPVFIPFKGYRYNPARVGSLGKVLSPPYDVISPEERTQLYRQSRYNFVRLDFRKGSSGHDPYREAGKELGRWLDEGIFQREGGHAFYVYIQRYRNLQGRPSRRMGLIGLMDVNPRFVKGHEDTLEKPRRDRTRLLKAVRANLSPILGLYEDRGGKVHHWLAKTVRSRPQVCVQVDGVRHELYVERDTLRILKIATLLRSKPVFLADGHHRYRVSLEYHRKRKGKALRDEASRYILACLCDTDRNDLTIYPTHRLLEDIDPLLLDFFLRKIEGSFKFEWHRTVGALLRAMKPVPRKRVQFGLIFSSRREEGALKFLRLISRQVGRDAAVRILHREFLPDLLGGADGMRSGRIVFTRDPSEVLAWVKARAERVGVLLPHMSVQEMMRFSRKGILLPQKSTYFYPKLLSGLVFYKF